MGRCMVSYTELRRVFFLLLLEISTIECIICICDYIIYVLNGNILEYYSKVLPIFMLCAGHDVWHRMNCSLYMCIKLI